MGRTIGHLFHAVAPALPYVGPLIGGLLDRSGSHRGRDIGAVAGLAGGLAGGAFNPQLQQFQRFEPSVIDPLGRAPDPMAQELRHQIASQIPSLISPSPEFSQPDVQAGLNIGLNRPRIPPELINPMLSGGLASAGRPKAREKQRMRKTTRVEGNATS